MTISEDANITLNISNQNMNTNATIEKIQKMRLNGMKGAYEASFETRNQGTFTNDEFIA
jgi:hypothetical protein